VATAIEEEAGASVFWAPRAGADRYPDWAEFEQSCRIPEAARSRVWRIAHDASRVCYLGQHLPADGEVLPLAAALWRGWFMEPVRAARGLFWQGRIAGHLWLVSPHSFPTYTTMTGAAAEAVMVALECLKGPGMLTLEVGGCEHQVVSELKARWRGPIVPVEPFAHLVVPAPLREELGSTDHTAYLPAVGAALALALGPPTPLSLCASYPAAAAGGA
jgi:hypothetical protein